MAEATGIASFSLATGRKGIALRQEPWQQKSAAGFADWCRERGHSPSAASSHRLYEIYRSVCDTDGLVWPYLQVYLDDVNQPYTLRPTWGHIYPDAELVRETRTERLQYSLDTEQGIEFGEIILASWEGEVLDVNGLPVQPGIILGGNTAKTSQEVVATMAITYVVEYYRHRMSIAPREPLPEQLAGKNFDSRDLYASTVRLFSGGEYEQIEIELPDDIGTCAGDDPYSYSYKAGWEDDGQVLYKVFLRRIYDYCSKVSIADADVYIDGELVRGEYVYLAPGDHRIQLMAPGYLPTDKDPLSNDIFHLDFPGEQVA